MEQQTDFSPTLGALAKALSGAQAKLDDAKKDGVNPHFKNRYATLASVRAAITPVLSGAGLAVVQTTEPHGDAGVCVVTMLLHESGEWIRGRLFIPVGKKDAQGFGAAVSYGRRFALGAIVGIATEDDDDGEQAARPGPAPAREVKPAPKSPAPASSVDEDALVRALEEAQNADQLSKASIAVGRSRDKLSPQGIERCRNAHDASLRRLEKGEAA